MFETFRFYEWYFCVIGIPNNSLPNNYNHPVAPYQNFEVQNPRLDTPMTMNPEEMLAIEGDTPRVTYPALTNGINTYPAIMNGMPTTSSQMVTPYTRSVIPATSKALVSPNNHVINGMNPYPQLDYQPGQQMVPVSQPMVPVTSSNGGRYIPDKYGNSLINNPAMAIDNALKKNTAPLPAIMAPHNGAVTPYVNGMVSDSEDEMDDNTKKALELEYQKNEENSKVSEEMKKAEPQVPNGDSNRKNSTSNNGTIKVAMVADISMSNFHQCK